MSLTNVSKYRPHRPHRLHCGRLQAFLAGGIVSCHRPRAIGYRPPRQRPPADRSPGNEPFSRAFSPIMVTAVDAVATFPSFTYGLLSAPCVSFCRTDTEPPSKRLHPSLQERRGGPRMVP